MIFSTNISDKTEFRHCTNRPIFDKLLTVQRCRITVSNMKTTAIRLMACAQ